MLLKVKNTIINCDRILKVEQIIDPKTDSKCCVVTFADSNILLTIEDFSIENFESAYNLANK
jgi:hypothetical protein